MSEETPNKCKVSVLWFRHGLRLHDNPALLEALKDTDEFYPIFIFDGESAGTKKVGYNRMCFLLESLNDLNEQLKKFGGKLYMFRGSPTQIFKRMWEELALQKICFEQHTVSIIGPPPRPVSDVNWKMVTFGKLPDDLAEEFKMFPETPRPEDFNVFCEAATERLVRWEGGETKALNNLLDRLDVEECAFRQGYYLPNQAQPDLLGPPTSLSPALRFGCLSVRRFYWSVHDLFNKVHNGEPPSCQNITGQLIWREYFYTMSVNNEFYAEMDRNPICLNIPWHDGGENGHLTKWKQGKTGFPFIDAVMRQLLQEGWIHHVGRNAVASFLTRGILWINWEAGVNHFLHYLLDADWSVCAGNWMWVSSSAFEQLLDCSHCICPVNYGHRLDPWGHYVKRYVPELHNYPVEFLYEPWKAPIEVQEKAGCVVGRDYPERIVDHKKASEQNRAYMQKIRDSLMKIPPHCGPSNEEETRQFMWLPETCLTHIHANHEA